MLLHICICICICIKVRWQWSTADIWSTGENARKFVAREAGFKGLYRSYTNSRCYTSRRFVPCSFIVRIVNFPLICSTKRGNTNIYRNSFFVKTVHDWNHKRKSNYLQIITHKTLLWDILLTQIYILHMEVLMECCYISVSVSVSV
jgi:hypothetical protein